MTADQTASAKPENLFGVCAALGEEFGFNPLWLRIALATSLLWNPLAVVTGYAAAGAAVWAIRHALPDRRIASTAADAADDQALAIANDVVELPRAA